MIAALRGQPVHAIKADVLHGAVHQNAAVLVDEDSGSFKTFKVSNVSNGATIMISKKSCVKSWDYDELSSDATIMVDFSEVCDKSDAVFAQTFTTAVICIASVFFLFSGNPF
eukprot:4666599-Ditylum_brightwellii.AAC.1